MKSSFRTSFLLFPLFVIFVLFFTNLSYVDATQTAAEKSGWEIMSNKVCGDTLCSEVESHPMTSAPSSIAYFPPSLKQISQGTNPSHVTCTEGKALVLTIKWITCMS